MDYLSNHAHLVIELIHSALDFHPYDFSDMHFLMASFLISEGKNGEGCIMIGLIS